jgi:hypothetical protein
VVSLLGARLFRLPESYWPAISTLTVMQYTLPINVPSPYLGKKPVITILM